MDMSKPNCIIMLGAQGSGKSTLAKSLKEKYGGFIVSADEYWTLENGDYVFNMDKLGDAHNWAFSQFCYHIYRLRNVYVDNTNARLDDVLKYANHAVKNGYNVYLLEPETEWRYNVDELLKRNVHNVPREGIERTLSRVKKTISTIETNINQNGFVLLKKVSVKVINEILNNGRE